MFQVRMVRFTFCRQIHIFVNKYIIQRRWYCGMETRDEYNFPLVVIIGATGTGKSKLAVELAKKFNGEVISADSMQVYKGLDIVTNKVTNAESDGVVHHALGFLDPLRRYTVADFKSACLPILCKLGSRKVLPIIVGGTNYYIESLLWKVLICDIAAKCEAEEPESKHSSCGKRVDEMLQILDSMHTMELYKKLKDVDCEMAGRVHPNDRRKIMRSLEVFYKYGRTHSSILQEQKSMSGASYLGGPLRFKKCLIFWLQCDQNVLDNRLDYRVDEMIQCGLIEELTNFYDNVIGSSTDNLSIVDCTKGIFQCIGVKEFEPYLRLHKEERSSALGKERLREGVDALKLVTRRYARKQLKWIRNRFINCYDREVPSVYALSVTDVALYHELVLVPASDILSSFLNVCWKWWSAQNH